MANHRTDSGFTLIELLMVVAITGIVAAIATPGLVRARMAGNEASAIGSLRSIDEGQKAFAITCGGGFYADSLVSLSTPPVNGGQAFISEDLNTDPAEKSGYMVSVLPQNPVNVGPVCNNTTVTDAYAVVADPLVPGSSGNRYFLTNGSAIWQDTNPFPAVFDGDPGQGSPIQ